MDKLKIKTQLVEAIKNEINKRQSSIQLAIEQAQESANEETKSTAGDKHDTARAMAQLEVEKMGKQLAEINKLKKVIPLLNPQLKEGKIELGSVVLTNRQNYYLSLSMGQLTVDDLSFYAISPMTPIGQLLLQNTAKSSILFNGQTIDVLEVF